VSPAAAAPTPTRAKPSSRRCNRHTASLERARGRTTNTTTKAPRRRAKPLRASHRRATSSGSGPRDTGRGVLRLGTVATPNTIDPDVSCKSTGSRMLKLSR
jgi:hypothetical protein